MCIELTTATHRPPLRRAAQGFTVIELMVTITVLAILIAIGLPNLREFLAGNRLSSNVNGFIGLVNYARSEAIVRNQDVVICPKDTSTNACTSTTTWNTQDVQAFVDVNGNGAFDSGDVLLKTIAAMDPSDSQTGFTQDAASVIVFGSAGFARAEQMFKIYAKSDDEAYQARMGRTVCVSRVGRVRVTAYAATSCPDF